MFGKSWGGFNGLQVAFCQPPALKAVVSIYSTGEKKENEMRESAFVRTLIDKHKQINESMFTFTECLWLFEIGGVLLVLRDETIVFCKKKSKDGITFL